MLWQGFARKEVAAGMDSGHRGVVPPPSHKALSGCLLVLTHLRWHFPWGRADICQEEEHLLSCPWPWPAQQHGREWEETPSNNYHPGRVGQSLCVQCLWFGFGPSRLRGGSAGSISGSGQLRGPCCTQESFGKTICLSLSFQVERPCSWGKKSRVENKYQEKEMWLLILKAGGSSRKGLRTWKDFLWWKVKGAFYSRDCCKNCLRHLTKTHCECIWPGTRLSCVLRIFHPVGHSLKILFALQNRCIIIFSFPNLSRSCI